MRGPIYSIILAAGKGTRMGAGDRHKVSLEIAGRPAILRALDTYTACGIWTHVVVVGSLAGDVMRTINRAEHSVLYVYQSELRGTGHAAKQGARILKDIGYDGPVLVVAGDKVIEQPAIENLMQTFEDSDCDMAILVGRRQGNPDLGRIVIDQDGAVLACAERRDVRQRRTWARLRSLAAAGDAADLRTVALAVVASEIPDTGKARIAFGDFWTRLHCETPLPSAELLALVPEAATRFEFVRPGGRTVRLSAGEVDETPWVNLSVYLFKAPALYYGLDHLTTDNAQGEEYLTDVIHHLVQAPTRDDQSFRLQPVTVDDPRQVMAFNTPAELAEIEAYYRKKQSSSVL